MCLSFHSQGAGFQPRSSAWWPSHSLHCIRPPLGDLLWPPPILYLSRIRKSRGVGPHKQHLAWESDSTPLPTLANVHLSFLEHQHPPPSRWRLTMIHKPGHAQGVELLIKELHPLQEKIRLTSNTPGKHPPKHTGISQLHLGDSSPFSFLFFSFLAKVYSPLQAHAPSSYSPDSLTGPSDTVRALTPGHCTHQLSGQQGHVLDDGQPHSPLGIFSQLHNGRQQGLGQLSDANHLIHAVQVGNDVQPHLRALRRRQGSEKMHLA